MNRDPRKFIVETQDFPMDFICYYKEDSVTISGGHYADLTISHGLGFAPLCFGVFSADGSANWEPMTGWGVPDADDYAEISSDNANITVAITNDTVSSHNYTYHVWGIMPSNISSDITIPSGASVWRLNTLQNYSKLITAGRTAATTGSTFTVATHSLGYVPEAMVWAELTSGRIRPLYLQYWGNYLPTATEIATIDGNALKAYVGTDAAQPISYIHYRIYGGQNG